MSAGGVPHEPAGKQPFWPSVLGIIYVVLGALATLGALMTPVFMLVMELVAARVPEANAAVFNQYKQHMGELWAISIAGLVLGLMVLVGGIHLVRRRATSRPLLLTWAAFKIVYGLLYAWLNYVTTIELGDAWAESEMMAGPMAMMDMRPMAIGSSVFSAVFYAAVPVFTIIWFLRGRIREQVAQWRTAA